MILVGKMYMDLSTTDHALSRGGERNALLNVFLQLWESGVNELLLLSREGA
jgi:hypothetical protein